VLTDYAAVIMVFEDLAGTRMPLNPFFNCRDEPLVETFRETVEDFLTPRANGLILDRIIATT
jgi:predicted NodU family carbamoyl transferase